MVSASRSQQQKRKRGNFQLDLEDMERRLVEFRMVLNREKRRCFEANMMPTYEKMLLDKLNEDKPEGEIQENAIQLQCLDDQAFIRLTNFLTYTIQMCTRPELQEKFQRVIRETLQQSRRQTVLYQQAMGAGQQPVEPFCLFCATDMNHPFLPYYNNLNANNNHDDNNRNKTHLNNGNHTTNASLTPPDSPSGAPIGEIELPLENQDAVGGSLAALAVVTETTNGTRNEQQAQIDDDETEEGEEEEEKKGEGDESRVDDSGDDETLDEIRDILDNLRESGRVSQARRASQQPVTRQHKKQILSQQLNQQQQSSTTVEADAAGEEPRRSSTPLSDSTTAPMVIDEHGPPVSPISKSAGLNSSIQKQAQQMRDADNLLRANGAGPSGLGQSSSSAPGVPNGARIEQISANLLKGVNLVSASAAATGLAASPSPSSSSARAHAGSDAAQGPAASGSRMASTTAQQAQSQQLFQSSAASNSSTGNLNIKKRPKKNSKHLRHHRSQQ